jgi:hypothetical protein
MGSRATHTSSNIRWHAMCALLAGGALVALTVDIVLRLAGTGDRAKHPLSPRADISDLSGPPQPPASEPPPLSEVAAAPVVRIDAMSKSDNGIDGAGLIGYWYTFSDGTGQIQPPAGSPHLEPVLLENRRAREVAGEGQRKWGGGFGFDLAGAGHPAQSGVDCSPYAGIQFEAFSKAGPIHLRVTFGDADTDPRGGVCDPASLSQESACYGDFGVDLDVPSGSWVERRATFAQATAPQWTKLEAAKKRGFRTDAVYSVHFSVRSEERKLPPFDLLISNVFFFHS